MIFLRSGVFAAAITLCSCTLSTAPEPAEFKLSAEALGKQYHATRKTGAVRLYAQEIKTTRDELGRETHQASGGALLVKDSMTPIYAMAPSISVTPEFSEAHGKATVKKNDRLYIGENDDAKIRIDGAAIIPEGAVKVSNIADEAAAAEAKTKAEARAKAKEEARAKKEAEEAVATAKAEEEAKARAEAKAVADAETKAKKEVEAQDRAAARADAKAKGEAEAKAVADAKKEAAAKALTEKEKAGEAAKGKDVAKKAKAKTADEPPAKLKTAATTRKKSSTSSKPKAKIATSSKPKSAPATPAKAAPVVDRSRLLNLMREPTER
jgi:hypothetical protein